MNPIIWIIPALPLLSFVLLLLFGRRLKEASALVGSLLTLGSLILSAIIFAGQWGGESVKSTFEWLAIGDTVLTVGYLINPLNALMLVIVSLVSFLVQVYSKGYMHGDERFPIFFGYLGLFTFAMLGLVLSPNLLQLYIFWELVGVGSFLLIGYYFYKSEAREAAKKAFIMTRIGDVGLFIGMILLFWQVGSFELDAIFDAVSGGDISEGWITLTAILIFVGAMGKSGQFPIHTWLPDAMEGPTPVSALIHAATMVAAGVYLVAAMFPLFEASETAMTTVAVVGGFTAIFAATIGLAQADIKRVLAYSTVSQLGYMMLALGSSGYVAGIFHLTTHAFFKALLFLAAGSVIHAVHTQNIHEMGGLWKKMKWTAPLFLIGAMAISGVPLLSGFFSKDEILASTYADGRFGLFWIAVVAAFITAFYMFRLFFLVFTGESRASDKKLKVHESPGVMVFPMVILGVLAIVAGYINTPMAPLLGDFLAQNPYLDIHHHDTHWWIPVVATGVSLLGIFMAWLVYAKKKVARLSAASPDFHYILLNKYFIDETYDYSFVKGTRGFSYLWYYVDRFVVEGLVQLITGIVAWVSKLGSKMHSGQVQLYGAVAFSGMAILLLIVALLGGYLT
ncbi:NADH-quinone oxidoreductase subunit L [Pseudalkalibacillus berkeleyi]|uniref:NADH-quinone oxidoreductase subunit L n=1 Tax=Pseudalkalibacillus berkeleyi TaxID=1069813 RepID=A0ABS9H464_9BACL|nr:NADH-quinone oxidoreductase subunit L [Pseudalkalibacillus berkeleyi]MCF6138886.1 NADH-quinone oxidoreductase subunit L [Pseudalkalibacillus berkeleyi]